MGKHLSLLTILKIGLIGAQSIFISMSKKVIYLSILILL